MYRSSSGGLVTAMYHLVRLDTDEAACVLAGTGVVEPGDFLVPEEEVNDPGGRYFDCPLCHATLTGGHAHVRPPEDWFEPSTLTVAEAQAAADTTFGQDASHYDGRPGPRDGIDAYWHKLSDGLHYYVDPLYADHMNAARGLGIPVLGAYHVLHGGVSVTDQADWMIQLADERTPWWRDWAYWVWVDDSEPFTYLTRPSVAESNAFCAAMVRRTGIPATSTWGYLPAWSYGTDVQRLQYPWIQSNYGSDPVGHYRQIYPGNQSSRWIGGGRRADLLQPGSNATIGNQTTCDYDAFPGSLDQLKSFMRPGTPPGPGSQERDMPVFMQAANGSQYMADANFERVWAFASNDVFQKVYAAAGRPSSPIVDPADVNNGVFGQYMGIYTVPRTAPGGVPGPAGPAGPQGVSGPPGPVGPPGPGAGSHVHDVTSTTGPNQPS